MPCEAGFVAGRAGVPGADFAVPGTAIGAVLAERSGPGVGAASPATGVPAACGHIVPSAITM